MISILSLRKSLEIQGKQTSSYFRSIRFNQSGSIRLNPLLSTQLTSFRTKNSQIINTSFSLSTYLYRDIFDSFPGGVNSLNEILFKKTGKRLISGYETNLYLIEFLLKNKCLDRELIILWRNALQKLPHFENNPLLVRIIGALTLGSGEINNIAMIPDGNRRWALTNGLSIEQGHAKGILETMPSMVKEIFNYGVHTFTGWQFSKHNLLTRTKSEVIDSILGNITSSLEIYQKLSQEMKIRVFCVGDRVSSHKDPDVLRAFRILQNRVALLEESTKLFDRHHLILAINHDAEDDLLRTIRKVYTCKINPYHLQSKDLLKYSDMGEQIHPIPDLLIRAASSPKGGRKGDFLPFTSDTCLFFTPRLFPELSMHDIFEAASVFSFPLAKYRSSSSTFSTVTTNKMLNPINDTTKNNNYTIIPSNLQRKVFCGILFIQDGKVLLGKRLNGILSGTWAPPAGHLEANELPEEAAAREAAEETGIKVSSTVPLSFVTGVFEETKESYIVYFILAKRWTGTPKITEPEKCQEWKWFHWNRLPKELAKPFKDFINSKTFDFKRIFEIQKVTLRDQTRIQFSKPIRPLLNQYESSRRDNGRPSPNNWIKSRISAPRPRPRGDRDPFGSNK